MAIPTSATRSPSLDIVNALKRVLLRRKIETQSHVVAPRQSFSEKKLLTVAYNAHDILFKSQTVFPFDLFPDSIILDREKLTIVNRFFFRVAKITSVPIRDILSVEADVGPLFGSVHMTSRYFFTNPHSINFLWRRDAVILQRLLQGYIIAHEQDIDCSDIEMSQLVGFLLDLGQSRS